jgi:hypothetical protein
MKKQSVAATLGIWAIVGLVAIGMAGHIAVIPSLSAILALKYSEYSSDALTIQAMLSGVTLAAQFVLLVVALLLRQIQKKRLLRDSSNGLVGALVGGFFALSISVGVLLFWLVLKNTLPPLLLGALVSGILTALAAGLVTLSLGSVLRDATYSKIELEAVI